MCCASVSKPFCTLRTTPGKRRPRACRGVQALRRRRQKGFSLLEVVLSLAILGGSMAVLGEVVRHSMENARVARDLTDAEFYCESILAEIEVGLRTTDPVSDEPIEPLSESTLAATTLSGETGWLCSIESEPIDEEGLVLLSVSVSQDPSRVKKPVTFTLTRMFLDQSQMSTDMTGSEDEGL